jgi:hypothetical protein
MATGRELAQLEDPEQFARYALFSGDGTKLIAEAKDGLRVWDLPRIRRELAKLGLDWDAPPYPSEKPDPTAGDPIEVRILGADLIADPNTTAHQTSGETNNDGITSDAGIHESVNDDRGVVNFSVRVDGGEVAR